jgi:glucose/mannose-6-phosphate isomerase
MPERDLLTIDQKFLHMIYEKWPEHFRNAMQLSCSLDKPPEFYNTIILCGMGGSATSCDILNDLLQYQGAIPSQVVRGGQLPGVVDSHSLVIVNSVSGNTEESLATVEEASRRRADVICISSGGKLREAALSYGSKHITIPDIFLPRASLPYLIIPGLKLISPFLKQIDKSGIPTLCESLSEIAKKISINVPEEENVARRIASFLKSGFVFCFSSPYLLSCGTRFKNSLNENAKLHCTKESILESTHNEIVPFTYKSNAFVRKVIFVQWKYDSKLVQQRFAKLQDFFSQIGQRYLRLISEEKSMLGAILCSIYILDYSTVYVAISNGIDPSPTPAIDILKKL